MWESVSRGGALQDCSHEIIHGYWVCLLPIWSQRFLFTAFFIYWDQRMCVCERVCVCISVCVCTDA